MSGKKNTTDIDPRSLIGRPIADKIREETRIEIEKYKDQGWPAKLVSITVGDTDAVDVYVRNQKRNAEKCGIAFEERGFNNDITQRELETAIAAMNTDPRVSGIIIQRPLPKHLSVKSLQTQVHPLKDVEGMHPTSIGNIVYNELDLAPCTAAASVELLKSTGLDLQGLEVVVVGHSEIVGKPIAFLLMSHGATVTVCHHMTRSLAAHARRADALFVAAGKPNLIDGDMVKPGAAVIDIGINTAHDNDGNEYITGDVDFDSVKDIASWVTPVPGGVGPVTVAILMRNTLTALKRQSAFYEQNFQLQYS